MRKMKYNKEDALEISALIEKIAEEAKKCFKLYEEVIGVEKVLIASNIPLEMHEEYERKSKEYEEKIQASQDVIEGYWTKIDEIKDKYKIEDN